MKWNKITMPHPPIIRMMETVKKSLISQGHEVIEWEPPISHQELLDFSVKVFGVDGYQEIVKEAELSGEPIIPELLYLCGGEFPHQSI